VWHRRRRAIAPASYWLRGAALVAARPELWPTAVRQGLRLARPRWWRRPPFLPIPAHDYLRFRFETQYGTPTPADADPHDLVAYLRWCRAMEQARRTTGGHR
jgi:hypothetical protein